MKLLRVSFTATVKTFRHMLRNGVSPAQNVMIRGFSGGNLEPESQKGVEPNLVSVIQGLIDERRSREAFMEVLEEANRKGLALALDEKTYTSLIHLLISHGWQIDAAYKVLSEMVDNGFSPSLATYNKVLYVYCQLRRVEEALGILRGMPERDVVSYNTVISMFCPFHRHQPQPDKALEMKAEMVDNGILPDADTYSRLIISLCMRERPSEAFDLLREMGSVSPDKVTYTCLMDAFRIHGQFSKAFHLQDEMIRKGFLPDFVTGITASHVTYNAIIHGLCFLDRVEEAVEILRGMPEIGLSPDVATYSTLIFGFCRIREPGKAYKLIVEMADKNISWFGMHGLYRDTHKAVMQGLSDEDSYSSLMNDFLAEGNLEKALELGDEMSHSDFGYLPQNVHYSVFLNGLNKKARTIVTIYYYYY